MQNTARADIRAALLAGSVPRTDTSAAAAGAGFGPRSDTPSQAISVYLEEDVAAAILGVSPRTLQRFRLIGGGPRWTTVGRGGHGVRYRRDWLDQWLESRAKGAA
jgi:hypothetical protein